LIQFFDVTKTFDNGMTALRSVNTHIREGEFIFLVGPSGAGKSTFFSLITREHLPTQGHVIIDGRNIERLSRSKVPFLRRSIGVVFQDFKLIESRTIYENVAFALQVTGCPWQKIEPKVNRVLDMLGLGQRGGSYPSQISGGERQRVCIARALVNDPAILLTDEPTGNLDPEISLEIMKIFLDINKRGTTLVVATHDVSLVERFAKRVIGLADGRLIRDSGGAGGGHYG
jgi:cell division transport system ATP-binding protein